jgi:acyl-coenzyme A synthetase/AMP-(fatty) acid ligase
VDADWLRQSPETAIVVPSASDAAVTMGRICFTSGTAGRAKAIEFGPDLLLTRLAGTARRSRINARSVVWCGLGPDTAYGFTATLATWLEGGAIVFSRGGGDYRYLRSQHVNLLVSSPAAVSALLRDPAASSLPPMQASVIVAGGRLSVSLRDALLDRLCTEVLVAYG